MLISSLTFPTVIETLKKFEFNIHYFSIDRNFKIIPPKPDDQKFDLLVMTYPFGFHINFEIIKSYLNKGSKTILDASHSQGMKIDNSNHVKFFDISFLSLQGNKSISGGEGGAILTDDENIYSKMINNHHPGHRLNKNLSVAGGITDLKLRMHPIAAVIGANDLKSFDVRNESLKEKVKNIYGYLDELNIKHPFNKNSIISGFHYGLPFFLLKEIKSDIIKKYNWYDNLDKFNLTSISKENNEIFFQNIYFLDLEWIKENKISIIKKKFSKFLMMYLDLDKNKLNVEQKLSKFSRLYDYIIIGTGPAASVILNNLIKKNKKILVIERGGFKKKFTENLYSDNLKIKNNYKCFGVGGTSNSWAHIYSFMSNREMCNNKNINIWPLSHKELTYWCKKVGPKYKFNTYNLKDEKIYKKKFLTRKFIELKNPLNFSKYYLKRKFDMITNCKVETLDETKKINSIFFSFKHKIYSIN